MEEIAQSTLTEEQKKEVEAIEAMPRRERRALAKRMGVRVNIPGSNKPIRYGEGHR